MFGIVVPPDAPAAPMTWVTPDWVAFAVVCAMVVAFAVYGFFVMRRTNRTVAPPGERHVELPRAA